MYPMLNGALISMIVPVYNVEKYLDQCIRSIIGQTYHNLDIILINDGSTDSSGMICDRWAAQDMRIQVIHKQNQGLGEARNTGLEHAKGQYVFFVDSDDFLADNAVQKLYESICIERCDTVFCGWSKYIDETNIIKNEQCFGGQKFTGNEFIIDRILLEMIGTAPHERMDNHFSMSVWHAIYSLDIIRDNKIRFYSERVLISEDIFFNMDYLRQAKSVYVISDCLYFYRFNANSLSISYNPDRFNKEMIMYHRLKHELGEFLAEDKYLLRLQRMFLGRVRSCTMRCLRLPNPMKEIKVIYSAQTVVEILKAYPYWENPLRHRVFNFCLKHRLGWGIFLLAKLGNSVF